MSVNNSPLIFIKTSATEALAHAPPSPEALKRGFQSVERYEVVNWDRIEVFPKGGGGWDKKCEWMHQPVVGYKEKRPWDSKKGNMIQHRLN